jgi:hypothetical protein
MRTEQGTAEPFFIHLFKGCVLFESLLKANVKHPPKEKMLGRVLNELTPELGLGAGPLATSVMDFQTIVNELPSDDGSVHAAIVRTGRIRNTTGHNLGWQTSLDVAAYDVLAESVATSCLHALSCLYG